MSTNHQAGNVYELRAHIHRVPVQHMLGTLGLEKVVTDITRRYSMPAQLQNSTLVQHLCE